jgi:hypothetical protein
MPGLYTHTDLALEAASIESVFAIKTHLGAFILGSTAPDMRVMTGQKREETHFTDLNATTLDAGVMGMFETHVSLLQPYLLGEATQAFLAGYIFHLIADQAWIINLYRPFFANTEVFPNVKEGSVLDRAFQLDMDLQARSRIKGSAKLSQLLSKSERNVSVSFIEEGVLHKWRQRMEDVADMDIGWDRLRFIAKRKFDQEDQETLDLVEGFLESVPLGLEYLYERVPGDNIISFRKTALTEFLRVTKEYWQC